MRVEHSVVVNAGDFATALAIVAPRSRKGRPPAQPVTLRHDAGAGALSISEAMHAARRRDVAAAGSWPARVQVDGVVLRRLCETLAPELVVTLLPLAGHLVVLAGAARVQIRRLDADGAPGILERDYRLNPRRNGAPVDTGQRRARRTPAAATWAFSARMPFSPEPSS